uniref:(northern house mosquito) hypothetical protein n=1 Tax=Culex pipiens TaxID=7175 RepID=A0A8D8HIM7_CULPI
MRRSFALLVITCCAGAALACNQPIRHYISMGCTPSAQRNAEGCPVSYDCPNVVGRRSDKCYLFGKSYAIGEKVPDDETSSICTALVNCVEDVDKSAKFIYAHVDCAEFFRPWKEGCIRQYAAGRCCSTGEVCDADKDKLAKCSLGGQTYYEGEKMQVPGDPCRSCYCDAGFNEKNLEGSCVEQKCSFEIYAVDKLQAGAAPVYKDGICCPWDWRTPSESAKIVRGSSSGSQGQCKFGDLTLNVGDSLEPLQDPQGTHQCECAIPPLVHCKLV